MTKICVLAKRNASSQQINLYSIRDNVLTVNELCENTVDVLVTACLDRMLCDLLNMITGKRERLISSTWSGLYG